MQNSSAGQPRQGKQGRRKAVRLIVDLISLALLTLLFRSTLASALGGDTGCANTGVLDAYQPTVSQLSNALASAGAGSLGPDYEPLGDLWAGYPNPSLVPASIPCTILKSIAYVESGWRQASSAPRGSTGLPLVSYSCGYGIMQITSPMTSPGLIDAAKQRLIARDYIFNVSYGAKMLVDKWNATPAIGNNNPAVLEDWYFAVWAYNNWSWQNNPNNPSYDPFRPPYSGSAGQNYTQYPYQELIWGRAANPPTIDGTVAWTPVNITLPDRGLIANPATRIIVDPQPTHTESCSNSPLPTATPTSTSTNTPTPTHTPTRTATPTFTPTPTNSPTPTNTPTPTATPLALLQASTTFMGFLAEPGKTPVPQTLTLTGNRAAIGWSIQSLPPWITAVPTGGATLPASVIVSAGPMDSPGSRSGSFIVQNTIRPENSIVVNVYQYLGQLRTLRFPLIYKQSTVPAN
ncbi:MAG: transglycosylase SLT domain-containing protein [Dehalococcoidia bacterium]|nr:transglycosylase SLT domain-containing protein [Dehalococcoidia bacterium]